MVDEKTSVTYEKGQLYYLRIADILPNPNQPRKYFDQAPAAQTPKKTSMQIGGQISNLSPETGKEAAHRPAKGRSKTLNCKTCPP